MRVFGEWGGVLPSFMSVSLWRPISPERLRTLRASMLELETQMRSASSDPTDHVAPSSSSDDQSAATIRQRWCTAHSKRAAALTSELAACLDMSTEMKGAGEEDALEARLETLGCCVPELRAALGGEARCSGDGARGEECAGPGPQAGPPLLMACTEAASMYVLFSGCLGRVSCPYGGRRAYRLRESTHVNRA